MLKINKKLVMVNFLVCCLFLVLFYPASFIFSKELPVLFFFVGMLMIKVRVQRKQFIRLKIPIISSTTLFILSITITYAQSFLSLGSLTNALDSVKFLFLAYFIFCYTLLPDYEREVFYIRVLAIVKIFIMVSLFFCVLQLILPNFLLWKYLSELSHVNHISIRPFGVTGNPTHASYIVIMFFCLFILIKDNVFAFFAFILLLFFQNKMTLISASLIILLFIFFSIRKLGVKLVLAVFFVIILLLFIQLSHLTSSFISDPTKLEKSHTYLHRYNLALDIINKSQNFEFVALGYPDKNYWIEVYGAFDSLVALLTFRYGIIFCIISYLLMSLYLKQRKKLHTVYLLLAVLLPTLTMVGFYHTKNAIILSFIVCLLWKKNSISTKKVSL